MQSVLEYISANYTWYLGGAIIVLLAVIGSYADKTNFGQGKEKGQTDNNKKQNDITEKLEGKLLNEVVGQKKVIADKPVNNQYNYNQNVMDNNINNIELTNNGVIQNDLEIKSNTESENNMNNTQEFNSNAKGNESKTIEKMDNVENGNEVINTELVQDTDLMKANSLENNNADVVIASDNDDLAKLQENDVFSIESKNDNFQEFDKEFSSIIPQKDILNESFLDEIDNLSLDKTQKFEFNKDTNKMDTFDDIELPQMKSLDKSKNDLWKF